MKKSRKVHEAIALVFRELGVEAMLPREILAAIEARDLYEFLTDDKLGVVRRELRRHTVGAEFKSASFNKRYVQDANGRFRLINPVRKESAEQPRTKLDQLRALREQHIKEVRAAIIASLKAMDPYVFEQFGKRLAETYGFRDVEVTQKSSDGGIDGNGNLHFGLAELKAAFQCKRYTETPVGLEELHRFRGAISGKFQLGIFFTTSRFTKKAVEDSLRPGAVPIALMDGEKITQFMIDHDLAVTKEMVALYSYTPDTLLDQGEEIRA